MKAEELEKAGFKKVTDNGDFWFQFKQGKHEFVSTSFSHNKRKFVIGYFVNDYEIFWFNDRLSNMDDFKMIFKLLTGKEFKTPLK